ncbi:hypothetical protein N7G274_006955 [Stereocaulon virgatum]|uniref:Uncharacterized protein n=1 Tax=Stereocaulon virgatum TaxID=373712 RepID=A0ABR4A6P3_9LECA
MLIDGSDLVCLSEAETQAGKPEIGRSIAKLKLEEMWPNKHEGSGNGGEAIRNISVLAAGGFGSANDEVVAQPWLRQGAGERMVVRIQDGAVGEDGLSSACCAMGMGIFQVAGEY